MTQIAEKILKYCSKSHIDVDQIAVSFIPDYKEQPQFMHLTAGERLLSEVMNSWQIDVSHSGLEPRRALAEKLSELGDILSKHSGEQYSRPKFEKLSKVCAVANCQLTKLI